MVNKKAMGKTIKDLRKKNRMTVAECCKAVGVSLSAWRKYEIGDRVPRDETKIAIAKLFNRSIKFIFFED